MRLLAFLAFLLPVLAFAQPATKAVVTPTKAKVVEVAKAPAASLPSSQPASAPVVAQVKVQVASTKVTPAAQPSWKVWIADNWLWILLVVIIPSIINGLKKKGVRKGVIGFLESLLDRASAATNKNTLGTFKPPLTRSGPPKE
jgi:hypothetical protein